MPKKERPKRRPLSYLDAQDKVISLNTIYRTEAFGADRARTTIAASAHRALDEVALPEPEEDLEDAELSDADRQAAIARERMRREGRA